MPVPVKLILPPPHQIQRPFVYWSDLHPKAQCLIAPCGTKVGKSFGAALWMIKEALVNPGLFCIWIGPTYLKSKIGYRYMKRFLMDHPSVDCVDGLMEIRLANGSFIKFLHGHDAETTVEGEAVDRFVIDEAGKQDKQLWFSLLTTISQTRGIGIVTGTPRGFTWYYENFKKAQNGDPFFVWTQLKTAQSPFIQAEAVARAKRLLPPLLFQQYYEAMFVSMSTVFGDVSGMFDRNLEVKSGAKFWIHPDAAARALDTCTGWDMAKARDWTVFYTVNTLGQLVGYARFRRIAYEHQVDRLKMYLHRYFTGDRSLRYDATGVGAAVGEMLVDKDIDATITPVIFSQQSKQEMISRTTMAIESGWHKAPPIPQIEHEFGSYELKVTKSGLFTYSAPDGEHDDVVSAAMLGVSGAYMDEATAKCDEQLDELMNGDGDDMDDYADLAADEEDDDFFAGDEEDTDDLYDDIA